jgi:hypothetical protein
MDKQQENIVLDGLARISTIFHNMGVSSKEIRDPKSPYPERLRNAFTELARGNALTNTAGINAEWQQHPELGNLCMAAISISETLRSIGAAEIKKSGPDNLKRLLGNPASYNPPTKTKGPSTGRHFSAYD